MPETDLKGKTVMIATTGKTQTPSVQYALEGRGATVVFSGHAPHDRSSIPLISGEIEKHKPKIDALVIHNTNTEWEDGLTTVLELTGRLKKALPVIVCDSCYDHTYIRRLRDVEAKYLNVDVMGPDRIASAVADAVNQHGKPGRSAGA